MTAHDSIQRARDFINVDYVVVSTGQSIMNSTDSQETKRSDMKWNNGWNLAILKEP